jgi:hypothetical protein
VCRGVIEEGELAAWTHAEGAKHPECATMAGVRANEYRGFCAKCGAEVLRREGVLVVQETRTAHGVYEKTYLVHCAGCSSRAS